MNLQVPNLIINLCLEKNVIFIFDSRMDSNVIMNGIYLHKELITGCMEYKDARCVSTRN